MERPCRLAIRGHCCRKLGTEVEAGRQMPLLIRMGCNETEIKVRTAFFVLSCAKVCRRWGWGEEGKVIVSPVFRQPIMLLE